MKILLKTTIDLKEAFYDNKAFTPCLLRMNSLPQWRETLTNTRHWFTEFAGNQWLISTEELSDRLGNMSDRMKKLLIETINNQNVSSREDLMAIYRGRLHSTLESWENGFQTTCNTTVNDVSLHDLKDAGYMLTMYDLELQQDFAPYENDIFRIGLAGTVNRPSPQGKIKAQLKTQINFPHRRLIAENLPKEITDYVIEQDESENKILKDQPWLGYAYKGPPPHKEKPLLLTAGLSQLLLNYVTGKSYTDVALTEGGMYLFDTNKYHEQLNNILNGLVRIEMPDKKTLRYHILPEN